MKVLTSSKINVFKFIPEFGIGGTERHVATLSRMLDRSRYNLRVGCVNRWGYFLDEIEANHIPVADYNINSLYKPGTFRQQLKFASDIKRHGIDIVHSYNFYANVFAIPAAKYAGIPVTIASIRDAGVYLTPAKKRLQKFVCRWADCVLVNAESIKGWLIEQGYHPDRIAVIKNGIDLSKFKRDNRSEFRRELGLPADAPLVVMLSRLNPQKGVEEFLEAAAYVSRLSPQAYFLLVGGAFIRRNGAIERDVAYYQELERCVARLGLGKRVIFTGFRNDVPMILSEAAISVLPSHSEGLSNTLLESMAAGVPVIATRVGGNPEIVEHGKGGILVPVRDSRALAEAIYAILKNRDLAKSLGEEGRRRVEERFSLERMVTETQDLYVKLLEKKSRNGAPAAGRAIS
jgi:glycosyltransferase involved in cell wall biosynthesis